MLSPFSTTRICSRDAKTRIRPRDWLKLADEKNRREQVGSAPTFLSVRADKFAKWKTSFTATNVSFFDPSPNDQRTEYSCA